MLGGDVVDPDGLVPHQHHEVLTLFGQAADGQGLVTLEDLIEELVGEIRDAAHLDESTAPGH